MILQLSDISKRFDGVRALQGASFSLVAGDVHALMGENGAGKSTLAKIIAGTIASDGGEFLVEGSPVAVRGPQDAQRLGISIIYQELDLFPHLTVAENLAIGNHQFKESGFVRITDLDHFAQPFLNQVGLTCGPRCEVRTLSMGERQLVAIARALSMRAKIILMDEPTSALFDDSVERLFNLIGALKSQGVAIVYVSHKMDEIFRICDRVTVMRDGKTIGTRAIHEVSSAELIGMMIGREWQARDRKPSKSNQEAVLSFSGVKTAKLRDVSFDLHKGEVLGIAGLLGSGRTEIGFALMGLDGLQNGRIDLRGKAMSIKSVKKAIDAGIRWLPEDRKLDGLMMQMTILENGTISDLAPVSWLGFINRRRELKAAMSPFDALSLKYSSTSLAVNTLSGGNQQKVLLSRCLLGNPDVVFLDDPTRGIDVGAKEDIYQLIEQLASQGKGILLVSSELPELLRCCDQILVMKEGQIAATVNAGQTTQQEILTLATHAPAVIGGLN
ncbi:MAG TPA: sugar ABC transporter ATP-binding protein [Terriglobales bacterium]|nr:sugar ABC transporter ATP-binding protein [Terriglobales bacterium]